ncbi:hypothetical protein BJP37_07015 [Moorena bouillonii PNG]|uniref:Uncharacterized protein n=1 Tax=Moorena bouillonii PNG TaxID=568701 RepID=A0A1U7MYN4_9CYAN|nr:hypothetical protein BJP37_07015 [Moorena bouillonii PNG]
MVDRSHYLLIPTLEQAEEFRLRSVYACDRGNEIGSLGILIVQYGWGDARLGMGGIALAFIAKI